jgi:hypothetical protein
MGRKLFVLAVSVTFAVGVPALLSDTGKAAAQTGGCTCYAAFDAIDSDLRNIGRRFNQASIGASGGSCAAACNAWRRDWFYKDACDNPTRINRGTRASWGFENAQGETLLGPDTWWCPMPPP